MLRIGNTKSSKLPNAVAARPIIGYRACNKLTLLASSAGVVAVNSCNPALCRVLLLESSRQVAPPGRRLLMLDGSCQVTLQVTIRLHYWFAGVTTMRCLTCEGQQLALCAPGGERAGSNHK